jgi:hypothetical protein
MATDSGKKIKFERVEQWHSKLLCFEIYLVYGFTYNTMACNLYIGRYMNSLD